MTFQLLLNTAFQSTTNISLTCKNCSLFYAEDHEKHKTIRVGSRQNKGGKYKKLAMDMLGGTAVFCLFLRNLKYKYEIENKTSIKKESPITMVSQRLLFKT